MKHLIFNVNSQSLQRVDNFKPAAGSVEYLTASFTFNPDWSGTTKTAKCRAGATIYDAVISSDGSCVIPWEVLVVDTAKQMFGKQDFYIWVEGVNGTKTITTNEVKIELNVQGAGSEANAGDPTASVYAQFIEDVKADTKASADTATTQAANASASAESAAASAASLKNDYSNALKGNASGAVVRLDDVSPVEHLPVVKVHEKNLVSFGTITFLKNKSYLLDNPIPAGTYTISAHITSNDTDGIYTAVSINSKNEVMKYLALKRNERVSATFTVEKPITNIDFCAAYNYSQSVDDTATWADIQLEHGNTATEYTPYIDPSAVKVTRCGKNFWHSRGLTYPRTVSGVTIDYDEDTQVYTFNGTSTAAGDLYVCPNNTHIMTINAGETWTLKVEVVGGNIDGVATSSGKISPLVNTSNYTNTIHANVEELFATKKYTEAADITKMYFYVYASGIVFNNFKCRVQFELSNKPTEFEKSKSMVEYTPNADGTIEGITSVAPTMTLLTDTDNTVIECEYNRDINKVIADIITQLAGG